MEIALISLEQGPLPPTGTALSPGSVQLPQPVLDQIKQKSQTYAEGTVALDVVNFVVDHLVDGW